MLDTDLTETLPATFSTADALRAGLSKWRLYELRDRGAIESIGRGLYRRADADLAEPADHDLLEIAHRSAPATVCLTSALVHHDLTDANPLVIDIAVPRGAHRPDLAARVSWHVFDRDTFQIGRDTIQIDSATRIGLYCAERSIIDAIRLRHREGEDLGYIALRRWLRRRGSQPAALYEMAGHFPHAESALRRALEILLHD
ncbi:MAG: type IV toxin-antitoxin system AbiEi family antitoxin domain-containing protein [Micromonosporaceae bacterium]